jgi:tetratricopeptide (TPR) repeat protein
MSEALEREFELENEQALDGGSAAIALALDGARHDPSLSGDIRSFLARQQHLIDAQLLHLHEQFTHLKLKHWGERLKLTLQALTILVGVLALGVVAMLAWQAHLANGVVIEAFSAPPDLAARGLTGQVIASEVEDRLNALQAATWSSRPATTYSNNWGHDIKVEIPETGVSVSELERFLRSWLGHETRVSGEVFHGDTGLTLTVRIAEQGGDAVTEPTGDLAALINRGAEAIYARTEPYRYSQYLIEQNRTAEAVPVLTKLAAEGSPSERPWALAGLAQLQTDPNRSVELAGQALALNPHLATAELAVSRSEVVLGRYQASREAQQRFLALLERPDHGGIGDADAASFIAGTTADLATEVGDYATCTRTMQEALPKVTDPRVRDSVQYELAFCTALAHQPAAALRMMGGLDDVALTRAFPHGSGIVEINHLARRELKDWEGALAQIRAVEAYLRSQPDAAMMWESLIRARLLPGEIEALNWLGRLDEARALVPLMPPDCYWCTTSRAHLAENMGNAKEADRLMALAIAKAPSWEGAYQWFTELRLRRGDYDGAIAMARRGNRVAPRAADLLEEWGEALAGKGDTQGAIAKYAAASALTPKWGRLHLKWGEALARLGRRDEARAQFRAAATLDLSSADRAELQAQT